MEAAPSRGASSKGSQNGIMRSPVERGQVPDIDREDRVIALEVHKLMSGWEKVKKFF
jgi:hypothetical protein